MTGYLNTGRWIVLAILVLGGVGGVNAPGFYIVMGIAFVVIDVLYHWLASFGWNQYVKHSPWVAKK